MAIINGRHVNNVPNTGVYGHELLKEMRPASGRRPVIHRGGVKFEAIQPNHRYSKRELLNKKGQPVKVDTIPERIKGSTFGGSRDALSKAIITEQVHDVAEHLFKQGVDFDEDNADWFVVPKYYLPKNWWNIAQFSPLLIAFPKEYPILPPIGFYLPDFMPGSANGHLYPNAYHDAWKEPVNHGWNWYCVYFKPGAWQPARMRRPGDWRRGDNLWTYMTHVAETLASGD